MLTLGPLKKPPAMDPNAAVDETPPAKVWSVRGCLHDFSQSTTMHGVARAGNEKSHFLIRIFWVLLVLVAAGWSCYSIQQIVQNYMSRPVSTVVSVMYEENVQFPAVTICNQNSIRDSEFQQIKFEHANSWSGSGSGSGSGFVSESPSSSPLPPFTLTATTSASTTSSTTTTEATPPSSSTEDPYALPNASDSSGSGSGSGSGYGPDYGYDYDYNWYNWYTDYESESNYKLDLTLKSFLNDLPPLNRSRLGHQLNKMLIHCMYQGYSCSHKNFTSFWNHIYGNCYTFNKDVSVIPVSKSGPAHGLSVLLNLETSEYLDLTETVGAKVVVHSPGAMPFPDDEGIIVSPGFATSVSIRRIDIRRAPQPYGNCLNYVDEENRRVNMYATMYDVEYTAKACQRSCIQRSTIDQCGCCDKDFPCIKSSNDTVLDSSNSTEDMRFCNVSNQLDAICTAGVRSDFEIGNLRCGEYCVPSCSETSYEAEVSMGLWPSEHALTQLNEKFEKMPKTYWGSGSYEQDFVRKNVVKIDVFFKQLNYELLETKPAYDWYRLLSDLGGQMGLWLGFSLLTAVEVLGLLLNLSRHVVYRILHRGSSTRVSQFQRNTTVKVIDLDKKAAVETTTTAIRDFKF